MGKLIRDKIPELIRASGETPVLRTLENEEYTVCLEEKLDEEVGEFHKDRNLEELADILEVVYALCENLGHSKAELTQVYEKKHAARGGFEQRFFLEGKI